MSKRLSKRMGNIAGLLVPRKERNHNRSRVDIDRLPNSQAEIAARSRF
jgi:hypothetical protein